MANLRTARCRRSVVAVVLLGLCMQISLVRAECKRECDPELIKQALLDPDCENTPVPHGSSSLRQACPQISCCYSLGSLFAAPDYCICDVIRKYELDVKYYTLLFRDCGGRELSC